MEDRFETVFFSEVSLHFFFLNEIRFLTHTIFFGVHQPKINLSRLRTFQLHLSCLEERRTFLRDSSATEEILGTSKKKSKSSSCFKNRWLNFRTGNFRSFPDTSRCLVETRPLDSGIDPSMAKRSQPTSPGWKKDTWKTKGWLSNHSQSVKKPENLGKNTPGLARMCPCRCSSVDWKKHVRLEGVSLGHLFFLCWGSADAIHPTFAVGIGGSLHTVDVNLVLKPYVSCRLIAVRGADEDLVLGRPEQKTLWTSEGSWSVM